MRNPSPLPTLVKEPGQLAGALAQGKQNANDKLETSAALGTRDNAPIQFAGERLGLNIAQTFGDAIASKEGFQAAQSLMNRMQHSPFALPIPGVDPQSGGMA